MKKITASVLLASTFAFAQAQANSSSVTGKWTVHSSIAGNESDTECTFTQKDNDLTGTCASGQGGVKTTGKLDGKKVTWSYDTEYNGSPLTMKYNGTLDAGKITGDVSVEQYGVGGDFTATPLK